MQDVLGDHREDVGAHQQTSPLKRQEKARHRGIPTLTGQAGPLKVKNKHSSAPTKRSWVQVQHVATVMDALEAILAHLKVSLPITHPRVGEIDDPTLPLMLSFSPRILPYRNYRWNYKHAAVSVGSASIVEGKSSRKNLRAWRCRRLRRLKKPRGKGRCIVLG